MTTTPVQPAAPAGAPLAPPSAGWSLGVSLLLAIAVPLAWLLTPHYEASGMPVAPLVPALAIALAGTACLGWRALPALAAAALVMASGWPQSGPTWSAGLDAAVLLAQAAFGGLLLRRSSRSDDLALDTPGSLQRLVACALACALLGGLGTLALALGSGASSRPVVVSLVRAAADGASVLVLLPVLLAFAAPQRQRWKPRRRQVALPLVVLAGLLLAAFAGIDERDRQHAQGRFERDAEALAARSQTLLDAPLQAVAAVHGFLRASPLTPSGTQFDALAQPWLARTDGIGALGWLEAGPAGQASVRHQIGQGGVLPQGRTGFSAAQDAALRGALARALAQDGAVATPVMPLGDAADVQPGIVVLQALPPEPGASQRSAAFVTVLAHRLMLPLLATRTDALRACLFDSDPRLESRRLHGPAGCDGLPPREASLRRDTPVPFAGRQWVLRLDQPLQTPGGVWLFALPALAGASLLSVMLLALTGRMQRLEAGARALSGDLQGRAMAQLDTVMQAVQTGVALLAPDGRIERANQALADLLGRPVAALAQQPIGEVLVDDDAPADTRLVERMLEADEPLMHRTLRLRLAEGRSVPALVTMCAMHETDGRIASIVCAVHDLSENLRRRHAERMLGDVLDRSGQAGAPE